MTDSMFMDDKQLVKNFWAYKTLRGRNVYLSGPVSYDPQRACFQFKTIETILKGVFDVSMVFNPTTDIIEGDENVHVLQHHEYMRACLYELCECKVMTNRYLAPKYDILLQLPGWHDSIGARFEKDVADMVHMRTMQWTDILDSASPTLQLRMQHSLYRALSGETDEAWKEGMLNARSAIFR